MSKDCNGFNNFSEACKRLCDVFNGLAEKQPAHTEEKHEEAKVKEKRYCVTCGSVDSRLCRECYNHSKWIPKRPDVDTCEHELVECIENQRCKLSRLRECFNIITQESKELREGVNKAIEEIENLDKEEIMYRCKEGATGSSWFICYDEVMEILKRI